MNEPASFNAILTIDFVNHVSASVLLLLALGVMRSKKSLSRYNRPVQLLLLAMLLMQLVAAALALGSLHASLYGAGLLFGSTIWTLALLRLIERGRKQPILVGLRVGALTILAFSAIALLYASQGPSVQTYNADVDKLLYSIYAPIILNAVLSIAALRIRVPSFQKDCRLFLLCSALFLGLELLHLLIEVSLKNGITALAYFHGFTAVLISILVVAASVRHTPRQSFMLSRPVIIFGSIAIPGALLIGFLVIASTYVGQFNFRWSGALQLLLVAAALASIYSLSISHQFRDHARVFINKNFFRHKYDYRNVWLNLIQTLSSISDNSEFFELSLQAVGEIFDADAGAMWLKRDNNNFDLASVWKMDTEIAQKVTLNDEFLDPLEHEEWIYALTRSGKQEHDRHLKAVPGWIREIPNGWIIAPLLVGKKLVGFLLLCKSEQNEALIWEDIDVIKSAGKQLASYILRQQSAEQLAESKQFDTYNKLTAFIMHDLKNLIAQQALVVENAKKHKENPAFVEDAIKTIDNSVERMNHLLKR
ncbi:MAG: hypothetical protein WBN40_02305, partial [Pseudomonadales bacterium]